jgi:hypothetical protein
MAPSVGDYLAALPNGNSEAILPEIEFSRPDTVDPWKSVPEGLFDKGTSSVAAGGGPLNPPFQIDRLHPVREAEPTIQITPESIGGTEPQ